MNRTLLTVAICTWNRSRLLRQTLEQMASLAVPDDVTWELLVVNNNCTDDTDAVIASFSDRLPMRRLFQPEPGLSNARNLAVSQAAGEYLVWTDDDALVSADWLTAYARAFAQHPEAAVFGGPVEPWFPNTAAPWLLAVWPTVAHVYATVDHGTAELSLTNQRLPVGANMALRMTEQRAHRYDPDVGYRLDRRVPGEETQVMRAILAAGGTGWWVPEARVRHYIPVERQTRKYLRSWYAGYGHYINRDGPDNAPLLLGQPRWLWKYAVVAEARYQAGRLFRKPEDWISDLRIASEAWGRLWMRRRSPSR